MSDCEENEEDLYQGTPPELQQMAQNAAANLLPARSRELYEKAYTKFCKWKREYKVGITSENVMLAYFEHMFKKVCPTTLWTRYSFLRSTLKLKERIDIKKYTLVLGFLKQNSVNYVPNRAKTLTDDQIRTFLATAPSEFFLIRVCFIFSLHGAMRCDELVHLRMCHLHDIPDKKTLFVEVLDTKNHIDRSFLIKDEFYDEVQKYLSLRPKNVPTDRVFLNYQFNTCTKQPVGKNKLAKMPSKIATFLNLPEPQKYTGHSFRRTSATTACNGGADLITLKRLGGWRGDKVAQAYVEDSMLSKNNIANIISKQIRGPAPETVEIPRQESVKVNGLNQNQEIPPNGEPARKKFKFVPKKPTFSSSISLPPADSASDFDNFISEEVVDNNLYISQSAVNDLVLVCEETDSMSNSDNFTEAVIDENNVVFAPVRNSSKGLPNNFIFNNCNVTFTVSGTNN